MPLIGKGLKITRIRTSSFCSTILEYTPANLIFVVTCTLTSQLRSKTHISLLNSIIPIKLTKTTNFTKALLGKIVRNNGKEET